MKSVKMIIAALVVVFGLTAVPAEAQFRFGPKVGVNINRLSFDNKAFNSDNRAGFNAGVMTEFTVPVIGIGVDLSVMYVRRNDKFETEGVWHKDYIDIPLNLKWKMNIPVVNNIVRPFITTGPDFAFLTSKRSFNNFRNKKCDVAWNFGLGVELFKHLQVAGSYGLGLNKFTSTEDYKEGKNKYWTVTAAYLF
ncbi:MAG: porin family protein [Paramuribaculum sp.]|nr:porin family protein [Paramuribaculum sp.]